jgi:hypothetical protein
LGRAKKARKGKKIITQSGKRRGLKRERAKARKERD